MAVLGGILRVGLIGRVRNDEAEGGNRPEKTRRVRDKNFGSYSSVNLAAATW